MGTPLTGTRIKDTYDGLLKKTDSTAITSSLEKVTDGLGNDTAISLSTLALRVDGDLELDGGLKDINGSLGVSGQTLKSNGVEVVWSSSTSKSYRETTSDDISDSDEVVNITSGSGTYSLPTAVGNDGLMLYIKNSGTGTITLDPNSTETIDGSTTIALSSKEAVTICSDGAGWIIL